MRQLAQGIHWALIRHRADAVPAGCYRVTADGRSLSWWNKSASSGDTLRGTVTNAVLTTR